MELEVLVELNDKIWMCVPKKNSCFIENCILSKMFELPKNKTIVKLSYMIVQGCIDPEVFSLVKAWEKIS